MSANFYFDFNVGYCRPMRARQYVLKKKSQDSRAQKSQNRRRYTNIPGKGIVTNSAKNALDQMVEVNRLVQILERMWTTYKNKKVLYCKRFEVSEGLSKSDNSK
jgi:hypothetical protein